MVFECWRQGKFSLRKEKPRQVSQVWRPVTLSKSITDLNLQYRFNDSGLEIQAEMNIETDSESALEYILLPEERKKWDNRVKSVRVVEGETLSAGTSELIYDLGESQQPMLFDFHVSRKNPGLVTAEYRQKAGNLHENMTETYTLCQGSSQHFPPMETQSACLLPEASIDTEDSLDEGEGDRECMLQYRAHYSKALLKAILPSLLGESEDLQRSFVNLKRLAEKGTLCPVSQCDHLSAVVARKSLTPSTRLRQRSNSFVSHPSPAVRLFHSETSVVVT